MTIIQALRFHAQHDVRVEDVELPSCGKDDVRVKIAYCGICGSDNPYTGVELPVVMGHEISGTIVEVGSNIEELKVGQNVAINPSMDDRHHGKEDCSVCQSGRRNLCKSWACYGLSAHGGGFADEIVVKPFSCIPVPEGVSLKVAALAEPLAVASHMIRISGFSDGHDVVILGAGPIGLALLLLLRAKGAGKVIVSEVTDSRSRQAEKFGADLVINPLAKIPDGAGSGNSVVDAAHNIMGDGADIAFDAMGIQSTMDTALLVVKPGGVVFNVAIHEKPLLINPNSFSFKEVKLMGGICYTNEDFDDVLGILATGNLAAEDMITSVVPLEEVVQGGFLELINNKAKHVKILIQPSQSVDL
ncbi:related to alcohol/sorbitol dehydrogenase [Phialocephala subalpina]|uniref:Related to alcohol/sorbitol dehydrogenase n=1 Tax=Phialocephala subalpina TaxID=576137 RepID=A0A1L7XXG5_9HELO|nr:related to alcohol/sorbitol dehydrogenase [Phialocephala subalpina]